MRFSLRCVKSVIAFIYNTKGFFTAIGSVYSFELAVTSIVFDYFYILPHIPNRFSAPDVKC